MTKPMPWPSKSPRLRVKRKLQYALLSIACCWPPAQAQSFSELCELYSGLLMAPERVLIGTFRQLQKIAQPVVGPSNTRGRWIQRDVLIGQEAFNTIFYFKSGLVQRIELESTAPDAQCRTMTPWSGAIAALEAWQGNESVKAHFASGDSLQQSAHWSAGDVDVTAYLSVTTDACATKVALKKRDTKDGSEL